jgi:hypothetical protein
LVTPPDAAQLQQQVPAVQNRWLVVCCDGWGGNSLTRRERERQRQCRTDNDDSYWQAGSGGVNTSSAPHQHNFSVSVSGSTDTQSHLPPYITELAIIEL